ncbi:MAG: CoA-binding protein [Desulfobacterales bacterium]|nr:CoA-binding protein [Desulfobacterales bacterium]
MEKSSRSFNPARGLDYVLNPSSVAVIGASPSFAKWGQMILSNIMAAGFQGRVFPVNPKEETIYGLPVYKRVIEIPEAVDLALITTPAEMVPEILKDCGEKAVKAVVIVSSGFGETDEEGRRLEKEIVSICYQEGITLVGPNTMGIISPHAGLFATGVHTRPRKGSVAFVSQSGNLGVQLMHWAEKQGIGISLFLGSGNEAMITCTDYLDYLEQHALTEVIIVYVENMIEGRRFLETAKRITPKKPVIVLKGGRTEAGKAASASHTGAMGGELTMFRAACRQAGILEVTAPSELLDLSAGFSSLPLPKGNRVGIVTLGGGWAVVTADECNEKGLVVPAIPERMIQEIGRHLPPFWSKGNPVDLVGSHDPAVPLVAVEELLKWDGIDAVIGLGMVGRQGLVRLLINSTREVDASMSPGFLERIEILNQDYEQNYIEGIAGFMERYQKPVIGVSLTKTESGTVRPVPGRRYSPVFYQTPEDAVNVLARMVAYQNFLTALRK